MTRVLIPSFKFMLAWVMSFYVWKSYRYPDEKAMIRYELCSGKDQCNQRFRELSVLGAKSVKPTMCDLGDGDSMECLLTYVLPNEGACK